MRRETYEILAAYSASVLLIIAGLFMLALCSCTRTVYEPMEVVRTEYKDKVVERVTIDSVTDTRFVFIKGDTVIDYRDRVKWKEKLVHDSIYIERTDSIPVPYPVERKLSHWEQTKMDFGGMAIGAVAVVVCAAVVWLVKKFRK